ncbi:hypothetical protein OKA05_00625 [Luteolibacter arcticus]|uniref:Uncharacterized protein n=1 Tax=Luteolibacter arcticus TaxID=1581411 RepID=A0ABT3GC71_9BACT|nr:hypothetical protein [Luteolibacter arcticus]MCW1921036.1 hypothetical protein [Luteolibacter arcticus]
MKHRALYLSLMLAAMSSSVFAQAWLPKEAEVCYRSQYADGFLPDAAYCLKLKVTEKQFKEIVAKVGATLHTEKRPYTDDKVWLSWGPETGPDLKPVKGKERWNPSRDLAATYVRQEKHTWEFLKYEGGFLYYKSLTH